MPRDITGTELWHETSPVAPVRAAAPERHDLVSACYMCGAWPDDPSRCRSPGASACAQAGHRRGAEVEFETIHRLRLAR